MPATTDWIKQNMRGAALVGLLSIPSYAKEYRDTENKLKAIVKIMADWFFWTLKILAPLRAFFVGGAVVLGFKAVGDAIANIVRQTGSLEAALRRLSAIQMSERALAPFVGGIGAAKTRVAELLALSSRGPFKFEDLAAANQQLEVFTRGAYSSAEATRAVGMAAIATGNQIGDVATAVGDVYANLREGAPIQGSTERLRQMGIISQQVADDLVQMSQSGSTAAEVFNRLTGEVGKSAATMQEMGDTIEGVNAEYTKASDALKEKFGAPWTANEIQNTKNMTAAMQALAPTVGRISEGWAKLFGGFATVRTETIRVASSSKFLRDSLERLVTVFNSVITAATAVATVVLPLLIPKMFSLIDGLLGAQRAAGLLGIGLKGIAAGGAVGLAVTGAVMLVGAIINEVHAYREANREIARQDEAFRKSNSAIKEQIAMAKTLAEHQEGVAAAMNQVISTHQELIVAQKKSADSQRGFINRLFDPSIAGRIQDIKEAWEKVFGSATIEHAAERAKRAQETLTKAIHERGVGYAGPELQRLLEQRYRRGRVFEERQFQERLTFRPGEAPEIEEAMGRTLTRRAALGLPGAEARAYFENRTAGLNEERMAAQARHQIAQQELEAERQKDKPSKDRVAALKEETKLAQDSLKSIDAKILKEKLAAAEGSSVRKEAEAQLQRNLINSGLLTKEEAEQARIKSIGLDEAARELKLNEENAVELEDQGKQHLDNADLLRREQAIVRETSDLELARRQAERLGNTEKANALQNELEFEQKFEQYRRTLPEEEARRRALAETAESIAERETPAIGGLPAVVSSLARLGLGGGVYLPGGDPKIAIQKQIATLTASSNEYLRTMATSTRGVE